MKKQLMKMAMCLTLTLVSYSAFAVMPGESVSCSVGTTALDKQTVFNMKQIGPVEIKLSPFTGDGRTQASKVITLQDGYRVSLTLTYAPDVQLNGETGYAALSAMLQRVESSGKITVLAEGVGGSDRDSLKNPRFLFTSLTMKNPEIATAISNSRIVDATPFKLLKAGEIPNGIMSEVLVSCSLAK